MNALLRALFFTTLLYSAVGKTQTMHQFHIEGKKWNVGDIPFQEGGVVTWGKLSELSTESKATLESKRLFNEKLLSVLDLKSEPRSNTHIRIPLHMFELYWEMVDGNRRRKLDNFTETVHRVDSKPVKPRERPAFVAYSVFSKNIREYFAHIRDVTDDKRPVNNVRKKRSPGGSSPRDNGHSANSSPCRRRPLYVDFEEINWHEWIIAPPGYHANSCSGRCPTILPVHMNSTNHAQVMALVHSANRQLAPGPCCVPTKLGSISLLYIDDKDNIVMQNYPQMVATSCGCR